MKILFLIFYGFQEYNGISKKIRYQIDALREYGMDVRACHYEVMDDGSRKWMIDGQVLANLGTGITAKIKKDYHYSYCAVCSKRKNTMCIYPFLSQRKSFHHILCKNTKETRRQDSVGNTHLSLRPGILFL